MSDTFRTIASQADATIFGALGETVTFGGQPVVGVLTRQYVEVLGVEGYRPTFSCPANAAPPGAGRGSVIAYDGASYTVVGEQPDELGLTVLYILEAA